MSKKVEMVLRRERPITTSLTRKKKTMAGRRAKSSRKTWTGSWLVMRTQWEYPRKNVAGKVQRDKKPKTVKSGLRLSTRTATT